MKDIQKRYLHRQYSHPDLSELEYIGIDEFAVSKCHIYKTIVVNLLTAQVVYIGDGKDFNALEDFWKELKKTDVVI